MNSSLKWWQKAIIVNLIVSVLILLGVGANWFVIGYAAVAVYLLKFVPTKNIKGYDGIA